MNRRSMLKRSLAIGLLASHGRKTDLFADDAAEPKFTLDLCPGRIGIRANQKQTIEYAHQFGFQSVEPNVSELAGFSESELEELQASLAEKGLVWGAAGLPVDFRRDEPAFEADLKRLPAMAAALQRAGVTRMGTWLTPGDNELTYLANFHRHASRLGAAARVLADYGLRCGLEYVGPKTSRASRRFAFIHTLEETRELLHEIGANNMGVVLDSWHWYTAGETPQDLTSLENKDVVAVDLNDAPGGIARDEQIDNRRELPMASGVIDLKAFMAALVKIGYDGPIRAEPFNQKLNAMDDPAALQATAEAMKKTFALVGA